MVAMSNLKNKVLTAMGIIKYSFGFWRLFLSVFLYVLLLGLCMVLKIKIQYLPNALP